MCFSGQENDWLPFSTRQQSQGSRQTTIGWFSPQTHEEGYTLIWLAASELESYGVGAAKDCDDWEGLSRWARMTS